MTSSYRKPNMKSVKNVGIVLYCEDTSLGMWLDTLSWNLAKT